MYEFKTDGFCTYVDTGAPCPAVNLNPQLFADEVLAAFEVFISALGAADPKRCTNFEAEDGLQHRPRLNDEPTAVGRAVPTCGLR